MRGRKNREGNLPSRVIALDASDSPLTAGAAARVGFQALGLQGSVDGPTPKALRGMAQRQLDRAHDGLTEEWRGGFYRVQLALAEGYAGRVETPSAVEEFRAAAELAEPFGEFFALGRGSTWHRSCSRTEAGTRAASSSWIAGQPPTTWVPAVWSVGPSDWPLGLEYPFRSRPRARDRSAA